MNLLTVIALSAVFATTRSCPATFHLANKPIPGLQYGEMTYNFQLQRDTSSQLILVGGLDLDCTAQVTLSRTTNVSLSTFGSAIRAGRAAAIDIINSTVNLRDSTFNFGSSVNATVSRSTVNFQSSSLDNAVTPSNLIFQLNHADMELIKSSSLGMLSSGIAVGMQKGSKMSLTSSTLKMDMQSRFDMQVNSTLIAENLSIVLGSNSVVQFTPGSTLKAVGANSKFLSLGENARLTVNGDCVFNSVYVIVDFAFVSAATDPHFTCAK